MAEHKDAASLTRVIGEIEKFLTSAREAITCYQNDLDNTAHLTSIQSTFAQIHRSLKMVQNESAVRLGQELNLLARALVEQHMSEPEEALDTLMQGAVQLSAYLGNTLHSGVEQSMFVLPVINDLRKKRGKEPLPDSTFFFPETTSRIEPLEQVQLEQLEQNDLHSLLRKIRQRYQLTLAAYLRNQNTDGQLQVFGKIFAKLQDLSWGAPISPLWEASLALTEVLRQDAAQRTPQKTNLLRALDYQLRQFVEMGASYVNTTPDDSLFRGLLYNVACSTCDSEFVNTIKDRYNLQSILEQNQGSKVAEKVTENVAEKVAADPDDSDTSLVADPSAVALSEAGHIVSQAKDAMNRFIDSKDRLDCLKPLPQLTEKIFNTLSVTPFRHVSGLIKQCGDHVQHQWLDPDRLPAKEELEYLADFIANTEYYLEKLADSPDETHDALLDVAEESLKALLAEPSLEEEPLVAAEPHAVSPVKEASDELNITISEDTFFDGVTPAVLNEISPPIPNISSPPPESDPSDQSDALFDEDELTDNDLIDDEVLRVFVEDAHTLQKELAHEVMVWLQNQGSEPALKNIQRTYHTLKGNSRMVGASVIGELAWSIENMMSRLMAGTIKSSHELCLLVDQVTQMLPALIHDFSNQNQLLTADVLEYMERADALSRGEQYKVLDDEEPEDIPADFAPGTPCSTAQQEQAQQDIHLLSTFLTEARTHLEVLHTFVNQSRLQGGRCQISDEAAHALRSLKERVLATGVQPLATLIVALEKNISVFRAQRIPVDDRVLSMLEKGIGYIEDGLEQLTVSAQSPKLDTTHYLDWLEALHAQLLPEPTEDQTEEAAHTPHQKAALFTAQNLDVLLDADRYLENWQRALQHEQLKLFEQELASLIETASEAHLSSLVELCDALVSIINYLSTHEERLPRVLAAPLSNGFDALIDMINRIVAQQMPVPPQTVITQLRTSLELLLTSDAPTSTIPDAPDAMASADDFRLETYTEESLRARLAPDAGVAVDDHSSELLALFLEEATDLLEQCYVALDMWQHNPDNVKPVSDIQRCLHTLKGSARTAGQFDIADLTHAQEDAYHAVLSGHQPLSLVPFRLLHRALEQVDGMLRSIKSQQPLPASDKVIDELEAWVFDTQIDISFTPPAPHTESPKVLPDYLGQEHSEPTPDSATDEQPAEKENSSINTTVTFGALKNNETVRVSGSLLQQMLTLSTESDINRSRLAQQSQDMSQLLGEMDRTIDRVKEQLHCLDSKTLPRVSMHSELSELSKALLESASDLKDLKQSIAHKNSDVEMLITQQSRHQTALREKLINAQMVSFSHLLPRLNRITNQLSEELGKPVTLEVISAEGEMAKTVLDHVLAPLEHILRNAIVHGIEETTIEREQKGKPTTGRLTLTATHNGADITIKLDDDGRGINLNTVRQKAIEQNLIDPRDLLTPQETAALILEPGFTMQDTVTQLSGRGVGLDSANTSIRQLGGSIHIDTELEKGTTFILRLPLTLSAHRALVVRVGDYLYGLPLQAIDGIITVSPDALSTCYQTGQPLNYRGTACSLMYLGELLEQPMPDVQTEQCPVVIVQRNGQPMAFCSDELLGSQTLFIKTLGVQFSGLTGVDGATILGDGRVVTVIDPVALLRRHRIKKSTTL